MIHSFVYDKKNERKISLYNCTNMHFKMEHKNNSNNYNYYRLR